MWFKANFACEHAAQLASDLAKAEAGYNAACELYAEENNRRAAAEAERDEWQEAAMLNAKELAKAVEGLRRIAENDAAGEDWVRNPRAFAFSILSDLEGGRCPGPFHSPVVENSWGWESMDKDFTPDTQED